MLDPHINNMTILGRIEWPQQKYLKYVMSSKHHIQNKHNICKLTSNSAKTEPLFGKILI